MRVIILLVLVLFVSATFGGLDDFLPSRNSTFKVFYHALQDAEANIVISPIAIWLLLISIAHETSGVTWEEVSKALLLTEWRRDAFDELVTIRRLLLDSVNMKCLNFLFYDVDFRIHSDFVRYSSNYFNFVTRRLNFTDTNSTADNALKIMQDFNVPEEFVRDFIRREDFIDSTMIMCNYFEFKGEWVYPFNSSITDEVDNMMSLNGYNFRSANFDSLKASVTELAYRGLELQHMLLIRPHSGYDVKEVIRNLGKVSLNEINEGLDNETFSDPILVRVRLPRVIINSRVILNKQLSDMGLSSMFDTDSANFSGLADDEVNINEISHRVTIEFTETHTRVYSTIPGYAVNQMTCNETVNDPFIFLIAGYGTIKTVQVGGLYYKACVLNDGELR